MIHHVSIPAKNPLQVAQVLAQMWQGKVVPFPANEGSYVVVPSAKNGTMIEVYPLGAGVTS